MRLGLVLLSVLLSSIASNAAMLILARGGGAPGSSMVLTYVSWMCGFAPLFAVMLWKEDFSFFDSLKKSGRRSGVHLWLIPSLPALIMGTASLIEFPGTIGSFWRFITASPVELTSLSAIGISILSALCLVPTLVKELGVHCNWKWFASITMLFYVQDDLVAMAFGYLVRSDISLDSAHWAGAFPAFSIIQLLSPALFSVAFLLTMLWSNGDIRGAISLSLWLALQRFIAPLHGTLLGTGSLFLGVFLMWIAVGGVKQLKRSRQMVARAETPEV